jgi:hypothetical protein
VFEFCEIIDELFPTLEGAAIGAHEELQATLEMSTLGNCSDGLRRRAADFDYRCEASHLAAIASRRSIGVNLGRSRPIDRVTSQVTSQSAIEQTGGSNRSHALPFNISKTSAQATVARRRRS